MMKVKRTTRQLVAISLCCTFSFFLLYETIRIWNRLRIRKPAIQEVPMPGGLPGYHFRQKELSDLLQSNCNFSLPVPNIAHYVLLQKTDIYVYEYISIISANSFLTPCVILIHGDRVPTGKWWNKLLSNVTNLVFVHHKSPTHIFGQPVKHVEHKADILRLQILLEYGGIYLDTDTYVLRSFDPLRKYTLTLGLEEENVSVANGVIISSKDSPLINIWYLSYHSFDGNKWTDNSVRMGYKLWRLFPWLVHIEKNTLIRLGGYGSVARGNIKWNPKRYSVHIYARLLPRRNYEIEDLKKMPTTFGALSRLILFGNESIVGRRTVLPKQNKRKMSAKPASPVVRQSGRKKNRIVVKESI